jgi:hypothetical protein
VAGQHRRAELVLDGPEVGADGMGQRRRAVAQVEEPHRRQIAGLDEVGEALGDIARVDRVTVGRVNT